MAFPVTPDLNFTAKTGATLTSNRITSWANQGSQSYSVTPASASGPDTSLLSLNGTPVPFFNGTDYMQGDATYGRGANGVIITQALIRQQDNNEYFNYLWDSAITTARNYAFYRTNSGEILQLGDSSGNLTYDIVAAGDSYIDTWFVLTAVFDNTGNEKIFINGTKVNDLEVSSNIVSSSLTGITFGGRYDGYGTNAFHMAQFVEYRQTLTDQQITDSANEILSLWGLGGPTWNPYKVQGDPVPGINVIYIIADDRDFTNATIHDIATTNASGEAPPATDIPAGKHLFVVPSYEVPDPAPNGLTIGDTYSEIGRWIDGFPT